MISEENEMATTTSYSVSYNNSDYYMPIYRPPKVDLKRPITQYELFTNGSFKIYYQNLTTFLVNPPVADLSTYVASDN
jgi:hypothetical protein